MASWLNGRWLYPAVDRAHADLRRFGTPAPRLAPERFSSSARRLQLGQIVDLGSPQGDAEAGQPHPPELRVKAHVARLARAVGQVGHALLAGTQGMRDAGCGGTRDDIAGAQPVLFRTRRAARPQREHAAAVEHREDLLLLGVAVRRRALSASGKHNVAEAARN